MGTKNSLLEVIVDEVMPIVDEQVFNRCLCIGHKFFTGVVHHRYLHDCLSFSSFTSMIGHTLPIESFKKLHSLLTSIIVKFICFYDGSIVPSDAKGILRVSIY